MRKIHVADIRLKNNAGMIFPVCMAGAQALNLDAARWPVAPIAQATCSRCKAAFARRYSWARGR